MQYGPFISYARPDFLHPVCHNNEFPKEDFSCMCNDRCKLKLFTTTEIKLLSYNNYCRLLPMPCISQGQFSIDWLTGSDFAVALVSHCYALWLAKKTLMPLSRLIRSKTETNCGLLKHIFPCLACALSFDWFIGLYVSLEIGQSNYFGFVL